MKLGVSSAAEGQETVVEHGQNGRFQWAVDARSEGEGICLEVVAYDPKIAAGEAGSGQCSYPSPQRGILIMTSNRIRGKSAPKITVVGAAFDPVIRKVVVVSFDGARQILHPRYIRQKTASRRVRSLRYLAFAVKGPWCARRVTTYDTNAHRRWTVGWKVFDSGWRDDSRHSPSALCPH